MICDNCKKIFESSVSARREIDGVEYRYETCPYCGGDELSETSFCPICGETIAMSDDICDYHKTEIKEAYTKLMDTLSANTFKARYWVVDVIINLLDEDAENIPTVVPQKTEPKIVVSKDLVSSFYDLGYRAEDFTVIWKDTILDGKNLDEETAKAICSALEEFEEAISRGEDPR